MAFAENVIKKYVDSYEIARKYYSVLFMLNDIHLSEREIELFSFMAVRGDIQSSRSRRDFMDKYGTTPATLNNTISTLKKKKLLVKENNIISIIGKLKRDFNAGFNLKLAIRNA